MNSSPDEFEQLKQLLALKRHEQPPPGYFKYLPDKIMVKIERNDLSEHSTWWEWMVERFDARPVLAGAYAFAISGLMLLGFKVSQDLQGEVASDKSFGGGFVGATPDPLSISPGPSIQSHFANPAALINFSSAEPVFYEPLPLSSHKIFPVHGTFGSGQ